ncbi:uncharacterized protein L969DRAFT_97347 [Mixia osmundae IAM 14324]|uniref:MI domain-containing protein n=1 Tax=Mixia osmundae (strain CBS 9802 / IAM 14324 / JCM 22182 / KY 12970) TaxID=764103 RepID=G7DV36_MIXOS|nr:uncharacterized protein L969DRAFT_97347 [Mixia osmundae IAM 14324]KEI36337.1 hypothetical protein L969DRAFT_97347 [Mixia osmundae IAM 14324]GAA94446.1 hypothetical protein E5Q_01098 [Mixia osmundae IAM 14324]
MSRSPSPTMGSVDAPDAIGKRKRDLPEDGTDGEASLTNGARHTRRPRVSASQLNEDEQSTRMPVIRDNDPERRRERERQMALRLAEEEALGAPLVKPKENPVVEMKKMALTKAGGTYIPPHRLRAMLAEASESDPAGAEAQRLRWDALRKSINGHINKVNVSNIKMVIPELFVENLNRGRGLFARSIMRAQSSSLPFTPVFAALVAVINTKLPSLGELLLTRLVLQFRRSFKRNDKPTCHASATFIAHLVNQQVADATLAFQILLLMLNNPTDDSIELAVGFMREVGAHLAECSAKYNESVFARFRAILNETGIDKRVQYMIEVLFQVRKDKFVDNPAIPEGLDLVEEADMITHELSLTDQSLKNEEMLNVFKVDPEFDQNEQEYAAFKAEILGEDEESGTEGSDEDEEDEAADPSIPAQVDIQDHTSTDLINLRRKIYLTIMSALDFEEAVHKLLKVALLPGQEIEMCNMIVECCSQERSYSKFYGFMGERLCKLNMTWGFAFQECFRVYFDTIHRYETNKLRNIARFFGHLVASNALPWSALEVIHMNEDETTSSSRIFVKIMFSELVEDLGLAQVKARFLEPENQHFFKGIFPTDNPRNTRFSINFWTSIQMGALTEGMREHLKNAPAILMAQRKQIAADSSDSDSSLSSSDSDSDSSSLSRSSTYSYASRKRTNGNGRGRSLSRTPPGRRSYDSRSPPPRRRADSRSPPRRRRDDSRSPAPRRRDDSRSPPRRRRPVDARSPPIRRRAGSRSPPPPRRRADSRSPPRKRYDSRSPPPRRRMADSRSPSPVRPARRQISPLEPSRRRPRSPSPVRQTNGAQRRYDSRSPPPRRRREYSDSPPVRRRASPVPVRRSPSPPPARASPSPPPRVSGFIHPDRLRMQQMGGRR